MGQQTTEDGLHKIDDSTKKIEATPVSAIWPQCLWPVSGGVLKRYLGSFDLQGKSHDHRDQAADEHVTDIVPPDARSGPIYLVGAGPPIGKAQSFMTERATP